MDTKVTSHEKNDYINRMKQGLLNLRSAIDVYNELHESKMTRNQLFWVLNNSFLVHIYTIIRALLSTRADDESLYNLFKADQPTLEIDKLNEEILANRAKQYKSLKTYVNKEIFHFDPKGSTHHGLTRDDINGIADQLFTFFDNHFTINSSPIKQIDNSTLAQQASVSFKAAAKIGKNDGEL